MPAKVLCFLNFKGGVGKTVTSVNIAANISRHFNKRVLIADLDPQSSATFCLMPQDKYHEWTAKGTLKDIYDAYIRREPPPDIRSLIVKRVTVRTRNQIVQDGGRRYYLPEGISNLDLLPSHLELIDIDYLLTELPEKHAIIGMEFEKIKDDYDYIVCDCPPNLYILTMNGILASDYYIIPVLPDYLSMMGIDLLRRRMTNMSQAFRKPFHCGGIIFTLVDIRTAVHNSRMREVASNTSLRRAGYIPYKSYVRRLVAVQYAADETLPLCVYDPKSQAADDYYEITKELIQRLK